MAIVEYCFMCQLSSNLIFIVDGKNIENSTNEIGQVSTLMCGPIPKNGSFQFNVSPPESI